MNTTMPFHTSGRQMLPTGTRLGPVHLDVTHSSRAVQFWGEVVGLTVLAQEETSTTLGAAGRPLIVLHPHAATRVARGRTGLYHVALHFDTLREFARALARLSTHRYEHAPTDHVVSQATYLHDPDGNGVELTFESPWRGANILLADGTPAVRTREGRLTSGREPLNTSALFADFSPQTDVDAPIASRLRVGHVHLHVAHADDAIVFYRDILGLQPLMHVPAFGMADFKVDDAVPHTIAVNTWAGVGAPPPMHGAAGLRHFTVAVPDAAGLQELVARLQVRTWPFEMGEQEIRLSDPSGNAIRVSTFLERPLGDDHHSLHGPAPHTANGHVGDVPAA